jgi:hypothetical protein
MRSGRGSVHTRHIILVLASAAAFGCARTPEEPKTPPDMARACDEEHYRSCVGLAYAYATGAGVPRDVDRATALYDRACRGGLIVGCVNLGVAYAQGSGVPQDLATAKGLFERACQSGPPNDAAVPVACVDDGVMLQLGLVGEPDIQQAAALYHRACAGGFVPACTKEALALWDQDRERAEALLSHACLARNARACRAIAQARAGAPEPDGVLLYARVIYHY